MWFFAVYLLQYQREQYVNILVHCKLLKVGEEPAQKSKNKRNGGPGAEKRGRESEKKRKKEKTVQRALREL